jgi:hypothetical protein
VRFGGCEGGREGGREGGKLTCLRCFVLSSQNLATPLVSALRYAASWFCHDLSHQECLSDQTIIVSMHAVKCGVWEGVGPSSHGLL